MRHRFVLRLLIIVLIESFGDCCLNQLMYLSSSLTRSSNLTDLFNAASTNDATCFSMDGLGFLDISFLAFLNPALEILELVALHSFSASFCSLLRFLYSPVL